MSENPNPSPAPDAGGRAPGRRRLVTVALALGAALWLVAVAIVVPKLIDRNKVDPNPASGEPPPAGLADVHSYEFDSTAHEEGDIDYPEHPPTGGEHSGQWWECGTYDEPVRDENMVHSLEHGTVWVTYLPGSLDDLQITKISAELPQKQVISPYPDQPAEVMITVWGRQLELSGPDDPRLAEFVQEYGDGHTSPEPFASCAGGVTDADGGTSAAA